MNYELAKKLKESGFNQEPENGYERGGFIYEPTSEYILVNKEACSPIIQATYQMYKDGIERGDDLIKIPTLSELIKATTLMRLECSYAMEDSNNEWIAKPYSQDFNPDWIGRGTTPEEAVAHLWFILNIACTK